MGHDGEPQSTPGAELPAIDVGERRGAVVITVVGELDYPEAHQLRSTTHALLPVLNGRSLVLDLGAVSYLGSAGLAALIEIAAAVEQHSNDNNTLRIAVHQTPAVIRPLEVSGLNQLLHLYHELDDALTGHA